eukprot:CAMPEP_0198725650 /NCGR_PEP_ID=MMETSP1475-20131203/2913_1 /TAXON_ID= ORGANISM="Unidentified sp., Strain CCMP1999" /NCGR_SAMPLE_ID=MMETSP1475 /ASSEMBLY_ACC=CAM_ASM_001111 /LENGTH=62 /DNA_ID=CAMNT_0044487455 /DNA_START=64 /DNA_END=252 /DNA_ORIENTATION=+
MTRSGRRGEAYGAGAQRRGWKSAGETGVNPPPGGAAIAVLKPFLNGMERRGRDSGLEAFPKW